MLVYPGLALALYGRAARPYDCTRNTATVCQAAVSSIDNRIDLFLGQIALNNLNALTR